MLKLRRIAITGGLSCGKSLVGQRFSELGAYVVSTDKVVHQLLTPDTELGKKVIGLLGRDIVVDGLIDRTKIAKKVFGDYKLLHALENILHPAVREEIEKLYIQAQHSQSYPLFIAEVPLLFETGSDSWCDVIVTIVADPKTCRKRFKETTGYGNDEYDKRMARQLPLSEKINRANYIIYNDGTPEELKDEVTKLFSILTKNNNHK
jgi:dephospho-CoA kinase